MTQPWQGWQAGGQPRCTSATAGLRGRRRIPQRLLPELLPPETRPALRIHTLGAPGEGTGRLTKSRAAADNLPQEKKGCGRKRTWRGHSHRAERGQAGRAPPRRPWDPRHRQGQAPSCLERAQSPSGDRDSVSSAALGSLRLPRATLNTGKDWF